MTTDDGRQTIDDVIFDERVVDRATLVRVQPGDVLIVHVSENMLFAALDQLRQKLLIGLRPFGLHDVLITNTIDRLTVVRPEAGETVGQQPFSLVFDLAQRVEALERRLTPIDAKVDQ